MLTSLLRFPFKHPYWFALGLWLVMTFAANLVDSILTARAYNDWVRRMRFKGR